MLLYSLPPPLIPSIPPSFSTCPFSSLSTSDTPSDDMYKPKVMNEQGGSADRRLTKQTHTHSEWFRPANYSLPCNGSSSDNQMNSHVLLFVSVE